LAILAVGLGAGSCAWLEGGSVAERALLTREIEQLNGLIRRSETGPLFDSNRLVLVVHQRLVQEVLRASLPWEVVVGGRYRVTASAVECRFESDLRLLRIDSRVSALDRPSVGDFAELRLYADLTLTELDPEAGRVRGKLSLLAFEARRLEPIGRNPVALGLVEELGRLKLEAFLALERSFDVPLRLERSLAFKGVAGKGPLTLPAGRVVLRASALNVRALGQRLWVALDATPGEWQQAAARVEPGVEP